jgi:truncated hemoglobin YjbI
MRTLPSMKRITAWAQRVSNIMWRRWFVGPQVVRKKYTGRAMSESHKHLKITESEWAAFCKDFDDTMAKFNVPEAEHNELFAIVESTKNDIVCG